MKPPFIGDCPPRRSEMPIRFENVRKGMHIKVIETVRGRFDIGTQGHIGGGEVVRASGKVESNENGVITLEGGIKIEKAKMNKNTRIYRSRTPDRPGPFPDGPFPGIIDWTNPIQKTN